MSAAESQDDAALKKPPPTNTWLHKLGPLLAAYLFGTIATLIKTFAWWLNQWPTINSWNYVYKWMISAGTAGMEYAPLTKAMGVAVAHGVHLGLLTAYMEAADNFLRMMQQLALGDSLDWYDWLAALGLAICVGYQGYHHYTADQRKAREAREARAARAAVEMAENNASEAPQAEEQNILFDKDPDGQSVSTASQIAATPKSDAHTPVQAVLPEPSSPVDQMPESEAIIPVQSIDPAPESQDQPADSERIAPAQPAESQSADADRLNPENPFASPKKRKILAVILLCTITGSVVGASIGGTTGQAYVLATLATAAKTFAWWINQYPQLRGASFYKKWLCGWSIAAFIEYLPLIGAFTIASDNGVHLGLMTAFMEALDNFFRICQQRILDKPLAWYDLTAAAGMFLCVIFQGVMRFYYARK